MAYAFAPQFKPQVRQDGFHLPPHSPPTPPLHGQNGFDVFGILPDAFRRQHDSQMDFGDELATLIHHHPHERANSYPAEDAYRPPTHNIFDISAPSHIVNGPHAFSLPQRQDMPHPGSLHEFNTHAHFNSTLPALNSSMRFDPHPPSHEPSSLSSSFSHSFDHVHSQTRHTPSPVTSNASHHPPVDPISRSRSRSRAPSSGPGPTRTQSTSRQARATRPKRGNSISSVGGSSPPPRPQPGPIVIPGQHRSTSVNGLGVGSPLSMHPAGWYVPGHGEFSLPTPDSITSHAHFLDHGHDHALGYNGMGVSPKDVAALDSPPHVPGDKQAALASEKRRRRRESHNAVERRRRDNINEKISELATLIPECMLDPNAPPTLPNEDTVAGDAPKKEDAAEDGATPTEGAGVKANKGMILRKSVDYIRYLQQLVSAQASRNQELQSELERYRAADPGAAEDDGMGGLVLHESVDGFAFVQLPSVDEMDVEEDEEDERPGTAMTAVTTPSAGSGGTDDGEGSEEGEREAVEEERGRRGRDGRPRPLLVAKEEEVKVKEETS